MICHAFVDFSVIYDTVHLKWILVENLIFFESKHLRVSNKSKYLPFISDLSLSDVPAPGWHFRPRLICVPYQPLDATLGHIHLIVHDTAKDFDLAYGKKMCTFYF